MQLEISEKLGIGLFGDVWRGKDVELDRDVAIKIIRESAIGVADAKIHAKALARAIHPNVVSVLALDKVVDPATGEEVECVVMELITGGTLASYLDGNKPNVATVSRVGHAIIAGLRHIHSQKMYATLMMLSEKLNRC